MQWKRSNCSSRLIGTLMVFHAPICSLGCDRETQTAFADYVSQSELIELVESAESASVAIDAATQLRARWETEQPHRFPELSFSRLAFLYSVSDCPEPCVLLELSDDASSDEVRLSSLLLYTSNGFDRLLVEFRMQSGETAFWLRPFPFAPDEFRRVGQSELYRRQVFMTPQALAEVVDGQMIWYRIANGNIFEFYRSSIPDLVDRYATVELHRSPVPSWISSPVR
ncbi:MAG: hypothetical protein AAFR38_00035 [Planctomycetota bacterium]